MKQVIQPHLLDGRMIEGSPVRRMCYESDNERCLLKFVPPGRFRYCSEKCRVRYHVRLNYWKRKMSTPKVVRKEGKEQCDRKKLRLRSAALQRLEDHAEQHGVCPIGKKRGGWCPGRVNRNSLRSVDWQRTEAYPGRCIVFATFQDDFMEIEVREKLGTRYDRRWTTAEGYWLEED